MKNNRHRLTEDWRMYFCGTYIFAFIQGVLKTMIVDDVTRVHGGDDTQLDGMEFHGITTDGDGNTQHEVWNAEIREEFRPISGYYVLGNNGRKSWVTFNVPNRTQKKGVDSRHVVVNNGTGATGAQLARIFVQAQEYISKPGNRDFYVMANGAVHWKGLEVGRMDGATFVANEAHKNKEAVLWRLLQSI